METELVATGFAAIFLLLFRDCVILGYRLVRYTFNKIRG